MHWFRPLDSSCSWMWTDYGIHLLWRKNLSSMLKKILYKSNHSDMFKAFPLKGFLYIFAILFLSCFIFFLLDASYLFSWQNNIHKCRQILTAFTVCFSLITGCCYKFLENPASVKNGTTKDLVFNLLGVMVKKYNYGLGESTFFIGYYNVNNISIIVLSFYCLFPCPYKQGTCIYEWEIKIVHHKVSKLCWSL